MCCCDCSCCPCYCIQCPTCPPNCCDDPCCLTFAYVSAGVAIYITTSITIAETCHCVCYPNHRNQVCKKIQHCCTTCRNCCVCKKNIDIAPVDVPQIHIMIRNPDESLQLGTVIEK